MSRESIDRRIARIASRRYGVFTRAEALAAGATRNFVANRLADGRWREIHRSVYTISGAPSSWLQDLTAAVLFGGDGTLASHHAAAQLFGMPGIPPDFIEIIVPIARRIRSPGIVVHQTKELINVDRARVLAIPVTSPTRTLIDLAAVLPPDALEEVLDYCLRRELTSLPRLDRRIKALRASGRRGVRVIAELCDARSGMAALEDVYETRLLRVIRKGGLPEPVPQYAVRIDGHDYRFDFAYPHQKVGLESDGYASRASRLRWEKELARQNDILGDGWLLLRFTSTDIDQRPEYIVERISRELARRLSP